MSMIGYVAALSSTQAAAFVAHPDWATSFVDLSGEEPGAETGPWAPSARRVPSPMDAYRQDLAAQIPELAARFKAAEDARHDLRALGPYQPLLDLHKSWHILHYLFTGHVDEVEAPGNALLAGTPLGGDVGYGPARLLDAAETHAFSAFLAPLDSAILLRRFDAAKMQALDIYPMANTDLENAESFRGDVTASYPPLKRYVAEAAARNDSLLTWLS